MPERDPPAPIAPPLYALAHAIHEGGQTGHCDRENDHSFDHARGRRFAFRASIGDFLDVGRVRSNVAARRLASREFDSPGKERLAAD